MEGTGERGRTATLAALLALVLLGQGNLIEAESFALLARDTTLPEDFDAESYWRAANGRVLAEKGDLEGALRLHRDALEFNGRTDEIGIRADFLCSLAEVAKRAGRRGEAREALREAVELYDRKENLVGAAGARERLDALG